MTQPNNCDWESSETIGPFEKLYAQQELIYVRTFFGTIVFDEAFTYIDLVKNLFNGFTFMVDDEPTPNLDWNSENVPQFRMLFELAVAHEPELQPLRDLFKKYPNEKPCKLLDLVLFSSKREPFVLAKALSSIVFDEFVEELIMYLPIRAYKLFPENFNFQSEGEWFRLMAQWIDKVQTEVNNEDQPDGKKLKLAGDVESNPGPRSHPVYTHNNDPRVIQLEKALARRDSKIKTLLRQMQYIAKRPQAQMNPQSQGLFDDLRTFAKKAADIPDSERIDGVASDISRITNFLDSMLPVLQNNFSQTGLIITDKLVSIKEDLIKVIILILLIKLFMKFEKYRCAIALVLLFVCQHYGMHIKILEMVKDLIAQLRRPKAQIETEEVIYSSIFQTCGKILFAVLAFICVKKIPGKQDWDTYLMRLDRIPKAQAGAQKIYDFTTEYWNLAHETIKMMVLGKTREELRAAAGIYTEIDEWASKVRKYLELEERNKIDVDILVATEVEQLWKKGLEFKADKLLSREADKLVTTMLMPARSLYEYVSTSPIKGGGPRMKPVCVWLCGSSGVGKTEMVYPLCIDVLREMGLTTADDYQHQVYARQVETEFWDGYKGQKIVIYDDAFQKKDDRVTGNPELFEVIRSCNTFPQHLHMAALHDKNTFSSAELMLYTTNEMQVEINSLTFPDAFKNRMYDNAYIVTPKTIYRKFENVPGKDDIISLDLTMIDQQKAIDLSVYQFQKMNKNNEAVGPPIDYNQFAKLIAHQWKTQKQQSINKLKFLENYATRPVAQMDEEFFECDFDFASDISTRISKGETLESIEYEYSLKDVIFEAYHEWKKTNIKPNIWQKYIDRFNVVYVTFKNKLNMLKEEAIKILSEHPYLSMLGFIGIVIAMFGLYHTFIAGDDMLPLAEITTSGGACTIKQMRPTTELSSSGDIRMNKQMRPRTEIASSGDSITQKHVRIIAECDTEKECDKQYLSDFVKGKAPIAQGCSDPQALTLVTDILYKNTYKMMCRRGIYSRYIGNVTFVKGWVAAMPYHFITGMALYDLFDTTVCLTQDGEHELIQFPASYLLQKKGDGFTMTSNVVRLEHIRGGDQDCVLFCLHKQMCQPHRNIMSHIVTQDDLKLMTGAMKGTMSTFHKWDGMLLRMYHTFGKILSVDKTIEIDLNVKEKISFLQRSYYTYEISTSEGDCGSLIGIFSKRMTRKLIGMHIAGDQEGTAYACPWTFERITTAINKLEKIHGPVAQMEYAVDSMVNVHEKPKMPEGGFVPVGKSIIRLGQASKTALLKSRIFGLLRKATMAPSILKTTRINGILVDPMMNGLKKCGKIPKLLEEKDLAACVNDFSRIIRTDFCAKGKEEYRRVLTYREAVQGTGDEFMTPINRLTSPGIPFSQQRDGKPGKTKWLGCNEDYIFYTKESMEMQQHVDCLITDCLNGIIRGVYCADTLKDAKCDLEKVALGKTRVFSACPVHFVLAFRQYFLGFSAWCMHNRIDNEIAVGTNQYSLDWNKIAFRLQEKGSAVIAGDFSNFDGSLNAQILWAILDIVNDWYDDGEQNAKIRLGLWSHVVHSTHIFEDNVYMWTHSQPSGNPFTVMINSIYNSIVMRMSWRIVMKEHGLSGMDKFHKYVTMISYGDDNCLNIAHDVINLFNQQTIAEALDNIAHTYTDEGKTGEIVKYRSLNEINFLKRGFVFNHELQRFVAPLEERVIYEMLNWTRNTIDPDEILKTNVETAAREMALHGKSKFDNFCKEIRQLEGNFRIPPQILTYVEYLLDMRMNPETFFT